MHIETLKVFCDLVDLEIRARDGITVGIARWEAEHRIHARFQFIREMMLEAFGLGMDLVPRHAKRFRQVQLQQAMMADDLQRDLGRQWAWRCHRYADAFIAAPFSTASSMVPTR